MKNNQYTNNSLTLFSPFAWYYTGFAHSDGSLYFTIDKNKSFLGFRIAPVFTISLGVLSKDLIKDIAKFFGCGSVNITQTLATFRVTDFRQIWNIIIPHFLAFPFSGRKFLVFKIFTICCSLMLPFYNKSLPYWTIFRIIFLSFLMNEGSRRTLEELRNLLLIIQNAALSTGQLVKGEIYLTNNLIALLNNKALDILSFPQQFNINPVDFNLITQAPYITLSYILGIIEGDGSFFIKFLSSSSIYSFGFNITTSIDDLNILILIKIRLGCGNIEIKGKNWCRLTINRLEDLNSIIIPLVDSLELYRGNGKGLLSSKAKNYNVWKEGIKSHLIKDFSFKTAKSAEEKQIKITALTNFIIKSYNVHNNGKKRAHTLDNFLKLHGLNKK